MSRGSQPNTGPQNLRAENAAMVFLEPGLRSYCLGRTLHAVSRWNLLPSVCIFDTLK